MGEPKPDESNSTIQVLREMLHVIATEVEARRRDANWNRFRRIAIGLPAIILAIIVAIALIHDWLVAGGVIQRGSVPVVRIEGEIEAGRSSSASAIVPLIDKVFNDPSNRGLIIEINSPGGSPAQSSIIRDEIDRMKALHPTKKVVVVGEDFMASAAYLIASAADRIYVQKSTITGSIGVIYERFGVNRVMDKVGVDARIITAGVNKARMNMYQPERPEDQAKMKDLLDRMHEQFIAYVKKGRGSRLKDSPDLFTGDFWTGEQAIELGLVDAIGSDRLAAADEFGSEGLKPMNGSPFPSLLGLLMPHSMIDAVIPVEGPQELLQLR